MGCRRLSYDRTLETPLRVVRDEPEKVVVVYWWIELDGETCAERSRSKVVQGWMLPDPAMQFSNPYLGIANNPVSFVDPNGEIAMLLPLIIAGGVVGGAFTQASTGNDDFGQILVGGAIGGAAGAGFGAGAAAAGVAGAGFAGGFISGAAGGFVGGFTSSSLSTWHNGGSFGESLQSDLKSGAIGALISGAIGGVTSGFSAKSKGLDFWTGEFKNNADALEFIKGALVSKDNFITESSLPKIDLGSKNVSEKFRKLFQYLNDNGEYGYKINELIDLKTKFNKSIFREFTDSFFDGGLGQKSHSVNIEFPGTEISGQLRMSYWTDKSLISGGFSYGKTGNWHMLRLDSTTGSHMLELGFNSKSLYRFYTYNYLRMNSNKIH